MPVSPIRRFDAASLLLTAVCIAVATVGCKEKELHPHTVHKQQTDAAINPPPPADDVKPTLSNALNDEYRGKLELTVVTSVLTHGYAWLKVKDEASTGWIAAPMLRVPDGAKITVTEYVPGHDLDRAVVPESVVTALFAAQVTGELVAHIDVAEQSVVHPMMPAGGVTETDLELTLPEIEKADHDIAELHIRAAELDNRIIAVRAQAVRVVPSVGGYTFVFLRDGSGEGASRFLPTIIQTPVEPGDVRIFVGRLGRDRSFLKGGTHPLLLEYAAVAETDTEAEELKGIVAAHLAENATPIQAAPPPPPPPAPTPTDAPDQASDTP